MGRTGVIAAVASHRGGVSVGVIVTGDRGGIRLVVTLDRGCGTGAIKTVGGESIGGQHGQGKGEDQSAFHLVVVPGSMTLISRWSSHCP